MLHDSEVCLLLTILVHQIHLSTCKEWATKVTPSVVLGQDVSSGGLLEVQILRPQTRHVESEPLEVGPRNLCFNKPSRWFFRHTKVWEALSQTVLHRLLFWGRRMSRCHWVAAVWCGCLLSGQSSTGKCTRAVILLDIDQGVKFISFSLTFSSSIPANEFAKHDTPPRWLIVLKLWARGEVE